MGNKGKFRQVQILLCHFQMFEPDYVQYLIIYVIEGVLFFDLAFCAAICSQFFARVSLMACRKLGLEAANNAFCDTAVGHHFCIEVESVNV